MAIANDSTFFDQLTVTTSEDANAGYYVIAGATLTLPDGSTETIQSRSNIACIEQPVKIWTPNAFVPRGVNRIFKPLIVFGENSAYQLEVYDRYGKKLFESIDVDQGWNGRINAEDAPAGSYVYTITITQSNGEVIVDNGIFVLIR
ncbi:MAG: gliding motility-associated-like protein [Saprospiraceae bacterium]